MSEIKHYKRPDIDGGVLTDATEIAYYKQSQANDVMNNHMLGDFNENDNYVVKKEIVQELIKLTKVMQHTYGKTVFCISSKELKNYGHLEFAVKIERDSNRNGVASLELLESINKVGGYYQNINTVLLATYTDTFDSDFLTKAYKAFNIISKEDDYKGRKKLEDDELNEIIARKDYLAALNKTVNLKVSDTERKFYEARVAALSKDSEAGRSALMRFQLEANKLSKLFLNPNSANYYLKLNQLLDKVLENTKLDFDKNLIEKMNAAKTVYIDAQKMFTKQAQQDLLKTLPEQVIKPQIEQQNKAAASINAPKPEVAKLPAKEAPQQDKNFIEPTIRVEATKEDPQTLVQVDISKSNDFFDMKGNSFDIVDENIEVISKADESLLSQIESEESSISPFQINTFEQVNNKKPSNSKYHEIDSEETAIGK